MPATVRCNLCDTDVEIASHKESDQTVACSECGQQISVAKANSGAERLLLSEASVEQIVQELGRRGQKAILSLLEEPPQTKPAHPGSTVLGLQDSDTKIDYGVRHLASDAVDSERLGLLLRFFSDLHQQQELLAKQQQKSRKAGPTTTESNVLEDAVTPSDDKDKSLMSTTSLTSKEEANSSKQVKEVFSLKGDMLGMSLAEFKKKHRREVPELDLRLPWCSDELPASDIPELMIHAWHAQARIVHARTDHPKENCSPTIAGINSEMLIYQFIDEQLFQITGFFSTEGFHTVATSLRKKFGQPQCEQDRPRRLTWWKLNSTIELTFGNLNPREPAVLRYFHDELLEKAAQRKPSQTFDL